ncbi:MAG TPA: Clp1/GlmU family protein [bacterium]|nr:Clp1/GlmU family protein [bacterium]
MRVPESWQTAEAVPDLRGVVMMLGSVDVGKTTTATAIANAALRSRRSVVVVDADTGQSDIGPPATVGLAVGRTPVRSMEQFPMTAAFFVGDTSPRNVHRYVVEGTVRAVEWARARRAEVVVVDTTGWVEGPAAAAAKEQEIRYVRPQHVVALQWDAEIEPILARVPSDIIVHRLRSSPDVRSRPQEARRAMRMMRFRRYFASAQRHTLDLGALPAGRPAVYEGRVIPQHCMLTDIPRHALRHLLVGLADRDGWLAAMGSVVDVEPARRGVVVVAPLGSLAGVGALQWGALRVAPSGREEGRLA